MYSQSLLAKIFLSQLILLCIISRIESKDKCYVLALEGGGDKGAYQAGAIQGLVDNLGNDEIQWDVVTGISVGSLNGAGLSIYDLGSEKEAAEFLVSTWKGIKGKSDIYQNWWLGPLYGMFYKNSLYDTTPLKGLLEKVTAGNELKRKFVIGATNFRTATYDTFDESNLNKTDYVGAILSSSAFPVLFPNIDFKNNTYMDGGVKIGVDIAAGINKCLDSGFTEENVVVDVVLCNSKNIDEYKNPKYQTLNVLIRILEIFSYDNAMRDIDEIIEFFPKAQYRYVVAPTKSLPSGIVPLNFSPEQIDTMIQYGIDDAKKVIDDTFEGINSFQQILSSYKNEKLQRLRKTYKKSDKFLELDN